MKLLSGIAYGFVLGSALATTAFAVEPGGPETLISRQDAVRFEVQKRLAEPFRTSSETDKLERGALVEFYAEKAPLWVDDRGLTDKARAVMAEIRRADDYGLNSADYDLPTLKPGDGDTPAKSLAEAEFKLSRAVLDYAIHARGGRIVPQSLSGYLDPTLNLPDPREVLETIATAADAPAYLRSFQPQHPQFEALRRKLIEARGSADDKKLVQVPATGPLLRPGDSHAHVPLLRARLEVAEAEGDEGEEYGPTLATAVREFQKSRGLAPDGVVGPATRRAFAGNQPRDRVKSLLVNMERWRWLPNDLGSFHIRVNLPEFQFRVEDKGKVVHSERVVIGKVQNQTPVFSDEMEYIDFNPYWNVPNSIKIEEILPHLVRQSGGGFFGFGWGGTPPILARQNLFIKYNGRPVDPNSVDWQRVDIRNFHFYQPPGGPNVLGVVKFMFPNKHDVYMHDTPSKSLFDQTVRAFSHGCVRVRNPLKLAEILLSRDQGWSMTSVERAVATGDLQTVQLKTTIPVHITYFTAWVEDGGEIRYFGDVYGHDSRMTAALGL